MFGLVFGAVRARAAQVLTILVLTALAAAVAAAGPWYGFAAAADAAAAYLEVAPATQRTVSVASRVDTQGDPEGELRRFSDRVREGLPAGVANGFAGMTRPLSVRTGVAGTSMSVAYRDGFCDHVRLEGRCPQARGEIALSAEAAQRFGVTVGDSLNTVTSTSTGPLDLRVVALYTLVDPAGTYWSDRLFRAEAELDPAFTVTDTFRHAELWTPTMAYDVVLPDHLLRGDGGYDLATELTAADRRLGSHALRLSTLARPLYLAITRDRDTILRGVLTAGAQMLILTWFAVGLAGWYTSRDRRPDAALLKLRGVGRFGALRLAWGQHLVPLLAGAAIGAPVGYLVGRALAGPVHVTADHGTALTYSATAVAAVLVGSLAVLAAVEASMLVRPVTELLGGASRVRAWRPAFVDVLLLAVAAAAIYQAWSGDAEDGLGPAAPALVALAVGLASARLLSLIAVRGGVVALRTGRLRTGLTALRASRSPGTDRVFALVVVAVALFTTAAGGWAAETDARLARSAAELGAERVLTVEAPNRTVLLHAVRSTDPGGHEAMAAVRTWSGDREILEVDSSRLSAVTDWRPEYGPASALPEAVAAGQHEAPLVTADRLTVRARRDGPSDVALDLRLQHEATGMVLTAGFGTLRSGVQTLTASAPGCAVAPGCRIVRWEMTTPPDPDGRVEPPPAGAVVTVFGLGPDRTATGILDAAVLGDITRWRAGTKGAALDVTAVDGTLRLATDRNATADVVGADAWASDPMLPLPALVAGAEPDDWRDEDPTVKLYGDAVPLRVLDKAAALPMLGTTGLLVDLDSVRRLAAEIDPGGVYQVWLAPGARPGIADDLAAAGLVVAGSATTDAHASRLGDQGPAVVVRFALVAGIAALLIAAATVAVAATADRRSLTEQLKVLREQGLPRRVAITTSYAGTAVLIVTGVLGGVLAALLAVEITGRSVPAFTDGWAVLAPPDPLGAAAVAVATLVSLAILGLTGWLIQSPLVRSLREPEGDR
ncbi:ABC transporter permease [Actinoplanes sp. NPDC049802]|uniref:ABC transporter permease n=1 Tax=Actinoplanes sp. NPDC049802 TaxID=3154742 RepID=UPI00340ED2A2